MTKQIPSNLAQATAAEYAVAAELLFRGLNVSFPAVDNGVDLYVEGSIRIQIKSCKLRTNRVTPNGGYWFKLSQGAIVTGNNTIKKRGPRMFSEQVDFVVLVGVDPRRYWVVPAVELDMVSGLAINAVDTWPVVDEGKILELYGEPVHSESDRDQPSVATKRKSAKHVRGSNGLTQQEVADHLGISQYTVSRVVRGTYEGRGNRKTVNRGLANRIRENYEGKWNLIFNSLSLLQEAEQIAGRPAAVGIGS